MSTLILTVIVAVILGIILILTTIITLITIVFTIAWNPLCHYYFRKKGSNKSSSFTIAFFHPYCDTGGGGERVQPRAGRHLWERHRDQVRLIILTSILTF